jgi:hypothetical protein
MNAAGCYINIGQCRTAFPRSRSEITKLSGFSNDNIYSGNKMKVSTVNDILE